MNHDNDSMDFRQVKESLQACIGRDLERVILTNYTPQKLDYYQCRIQKATLMFLKSEPGNNQTWELEFETQSLQYDGAVANESQWQQFLELVTQLMRDAESDQLEVVDDEVIAAIESNEHNEGDNQLAEQMARSAIKTHVLTPEELEKAIGGMGLSGVQVFAHPSVNRAQQTSGPARAQRTSFKTAIVSAFKRLKAWVSQKIGQLFRSHRTAPMPTQPPLVSGTAPQVGGATAAQRPTITPQQFAKTLHGSLKEDLSSTNSEGARQHQGTNISDSNRMAPQLHVINKQGDKQLLWEKKETPGLSQWNCYKQLLSECEQADPVETGLLIDRLEDEKSSTFDINHFFKEIDPENKSLFVHIMKAWNQRTTGYYMEPLALSAAEQGLLVTDKGDGDHAQEFRENSVALKGNQTWVTQKIRFFTLDMTNPSAGQNGSFEIALTTKLDNKTKEVMGVSTQASNITGDGDVQGKLQRVLAPMTDARFEESPAIHGQGDG